MHVTCRDTPHKYEHRNQHIPTMSRSQPMQCSQALLEYVRTYIRTYTPTHVHTYIHRCMHACTHARIERMKHSKCWVAFKASMHTSTHVLSWRLPACIRAASPRIAKQPETRGLGAPVVLSHTPHVMGRHCPRAHHRTFDLLIIACGCQVCMSGTGACMHTATYDPPRRTTCPSRQPCVLWL